MSANIEEPQLAPVETQHFRVQFMPTVRLLWCSRRWLLRLAAMGLIIATAVAFLIPKEYQSTAQVIPPEPQSPLSSTATLATTSAVPAIIMGNNRGAAIIAILRSRTVQDDLINRFSLLKVYRCRQYTDAREKLTKRTALEENRRGGVVKIVVTDYDPHRAHDLAQGYVDELNNLLANLSTSSARRERIFLEERLKAIKQELDDSSLQLSQFSSKNATFNMQDQPKAMMEAAAKLQGELIVAESEVSALEPIYGDENVRLRSARMRVAELRHQLQKMGGTGANAAPDAKADDLYPSLRKMPLLGVTYQDFNRRVKIEETIYQVLTQQYELARVQEAKEIPTVRVLDAPEVPEKKSFPPRLLIILLGTCLTLMGSAAWIVGCEVWRRTDDTEPAKAFLREVLASRGKAPPRDSI